MLLPGKTHTEHPMGQLHLSLHVGTGHIYIYPSGWTNIQTEVRRKKQHYDIVSEMNYLIDSIQCKKTETVQCPHYQIIRLQ